MMGGAGLKRATQVAILNANYIARRLEGPLPVLYTGKNGMVAHECIVDLRPLKASTAGSASTMSPSGWSIMDSTRRPCRSRCLTR